MREPNEKRTAGRIDRLVSDVLAGHHLKATPSDAAEREAIQVAARLAGVRDGYPRMSPAFRRRLAHVLEKGEAPAWMNRRAALVAGLGLAAGAVGGVMAAEPLAGKLSGVRTARQPVPVPTHPNTRDIIDPRREVARWWDTGLVLTNMVEGVPHRVTAGSVGAFIIRRGSQVSGMSAYCTHLPCELVWLANQRVLNCPCHNVPFDVGGQAITEGYSLPALPVVKTRVLSDGRVEVLGT